MIDFNNILVKRNECILYKAVRNNGESNGWIGGNMPGFFLGQDRLLDSYKNDYLFYLALINPLNPKKMFSIFTPRNHRRLLNRNIYPKCSILLFEHAVSQESNNTDFTNPVILRHYISGGKAAPNVEPHYNSNGDVVWISNGQVVPDYENKAESFLIKFGGKPELIQASPHYYEKLHKDGFEFLFQIDEDGYPIELIEGDLPFGFGAVYVYAKIKDDIVEDTCVGYWQFS